MNYCATDAECANGICIKGKDKAYGKCLTRCTNNASCGDTPCTQIRNLGIPEGGYCLRPLTECGESDNLCDEPEGTGLCAEGTDPVDCKPATPPTTTPTSCNPFTQADCPATASCRLSSVSGSTYTTACSTFGTTAMGGACESGATCARGLECVAKKCRRYCNATTPCGTGSTCYNINVNNVDLSIGSCSVP